MTPYDPPCPSESSPPPGDENVARLLGLAYEPEAPPAEFAERLQDRLLEVAAAEAWRRQARKEQRPVNRRRWAWLASAAALLVCLGLGLLTLPRLSDKPTDEKQTATPPRSEQVVPVHLTAGPRPVSAPAETLKRGETLVTKAGERRRVMLPDGSALYLNQSTTITLDGERHVSLKTGEVFVEVAPRAVSETNANFTVQTPQRSVAALGTKFAVSADAKGTGVAVTQGKVKVSDLDRVLEAGQLLVADKAAPVALPRASHLLDWARDLMTAAEGVLVPESPYSGGALVAADAKGQEINLSLRKYHVDVHVEDGFARTTIDQTYFNHNTSRLEGTFYFPLPPDASLNRLAMYVDGVLMEGGMAEREYARGVFEEIMRKKKDPALLEWVDGSTFKMRVFPLEGRQEKRIILSYVQRLPGLYGRTSYRFPAGHNLGQVNEWSFHALVKHGAGLVWECDTHALKATKEKGDLLLDAEGKNVKLDQDVALDLFDRKDTTSSLGVARFSSAEHEGAKYLMLRYRPNLPGKAQRQRRDWVFLVETSGDRNPLLARTQIEIVRKLLDNAERDDTFAIVTAGTRTRTWAKEMQRATKENVAAAVTFLEKAQLIGALDLEKALAEVEPLLKVARNPHLVHVGSGLPALGERKADVLLKHLPEGTRYVGVGVGKRWGRDFMKQAAERTDGYFTQINPDEQVAWRAFDLFSTLNTPRLLNARVVDAAEKATFLSHGTSVAQGEELCAIARVEAGDLPEKVVVSGTHDGKAFSQELSVKDVANHADYLPRVWGRLEIDRLLADGADKNKDKIIALSKALYVMTPFTSLLVLENEAMYQQYKVDRGRKDHWAMYPCPAKIPVVYEPLGGPNQPVRPVGQTTAPDVLQSVVTRPEPALLQWPVAVAGDRTNYAADPGEPGLVTYTMPWNGRVNVNGINPYFAYSDGSVNMVSPYLNLYRTGQPALNYFELAQTVQAAGAVPALRLVTESLPRGYNPYVLGGPYGGAVGGGGFPGNFNGGFGGFGGMNGMGAGMGALGFGGSFGSGFGGGFNGYVPPGVVASTGVGGFPGQTGWTYTADPKLIGGPGAMPGGSPMGKASVKSGRNVSAEDLRQRWLLRRENKGNDWSERPSLQAEETRQRVRPNQAFLKALEKQRNDPDESVQWERLWGEDAKWEQWKRPGIVNDKGMALSSASGFLEGQHVVPKTAGWAHFTPLYQRPLFANNPSVFRDLLAFAPGLNTSNADLRALLESEGGVEAPKLGKIDDEARALIEKARKSGWFSVTIPEEKGQAALNLIADGSGRYFYDRMLSNGLRERVVCDGKTLLHLYPELGLGARRTLSRFHRNELLRLVPWALPPVEELARGAELRLVDERTVAIVLGDGPCVQLVFADGRLAERQVVDKPKGKVLARETYDADGTIRRFDAAGKEIAVTKLPMRPAVAPGLKANLKELVVLPMPWRTREVVLRKYSLPANYNPATDGASLGEEAATALLAAEFVQYNGNLQPFVHNRFWIKGDRRPGLYALVFGSGVAVSGQQGFAALANTPLGRYFVQVETNHVQSAGKGNGFIDRLREFHAIYQSLVTAGNRNNIPAAEAERIVRFVKECRSPEMAWAVTSLVLQYTTRMLHVNDATLFRKHLLEAACKTVAGSPALSYAARYELAVVLGDMDQKDEARRQFLELYRDTRKAGVLPPLDNNFRQVVTDNYRSPKEWVGLMREAADRLIKDGRRTAVFVLIEQCRSVGDQPLADELLERVTAGLEKGWERVAVRLLALESLVRARQWDKAERLLAGVLAEKEAATLALPWRLGFEIATGRKDVAKAMERLERALDLEYANLPDEIDLASIRRDYGQMLALYGQRASALAVLQQKPDAGLIDRVVKVADRWRELESEPKIPCQEAGRILQLLGAADRAWEYLTTIPALQGGEAAPWLELVQIERQQGEVELADKAYAAAVGADPSNAQLLWDRATLLQEAGRFPEARDVFRKLAEGKWDAKFQTLQDQARGQMGGL